MAFVRLPLVLAGSGLTVLAYHWSGEPVGREAGVVWSPLSLTVVNILCLLMLLRRRRVEGFSLRSVVGFRRESWPRDLVLGVVWSAGLGALLMVGVVAAVLVLHPSEGFAALETRFVGDADFSMRLPLWLSVLSALVFPIVNAPVEEIQYRGYSQPGLIAATNRPALGIVVTAIGFGLQHVVFAFTTTGAISYAVGFFFWGLGAGWIAYRQRSLVSLIVAHYLSNLSFGVVPLIFVLTG